MTRQSDMRALITAQDRQWQRWLTDARKIGAEHGQTAATWVEIDSDESARRLLCGLNDGDSLVLDALPAPPSGEYTDDYSPRELYAEIGASEASETDDLELWTAYADAFTEAVHTQVERRCLDQIGEE